MYIGVISDTHNRLKSIDLALEYFYEQQVEAIIHCGDWKSLTTVEYFAKMAARLQLPVRGVLGNNDLDVAAFLAYADQAPGDFKLTEGVYELHLPGGAELAAYHGHHAPTLRNLLADEVLKVLLLGHTHKPAIIQQSDRLIVNPGSTAFSIPRSSGFVPAVAIVDTDRLTAEIHYLET